MQPVRGGNLADSRLRWDQLLNVLREGKMDARRAAALEKVAAIEEKISGPNSDATVRRIEELAEWLESEGFPAKARPWRARLRAARPPWAPPIHLVEWPASQKDLEAKGLFGFPQHEATVLENAPDFRVSAWSNREWLVVQSIWRDDGDDTIVESSDGQETGDFSVLAIDIDGNGIITANLDRDYILNVPPSIPGMSFNTRLSPTTTTTLDRETSASRGALRYVRFPDGAIWRIDTIAVPLAELKLSPRAVPRVLFFAGSFRARP